MRSSISLYHATLVVICDNIVFSLEWYIAQAHICQYRHTTTFTIEIGFEICWGIHNGSILPNHILHISILHSISSVHYIHQLVRISSNHQSHCIVHNGFQIPLYCVQWISLCTIQSHCIVHNGFRKNIFNFIVHNTMSEPKSLICFFF